MTEVDGVRGGGTCSTAGSDGGGGGGGGGGELGSLVKDCFRGGTVFSFMLGSGASEPRLVLRLGGAARFWLCNCREGNSSLDFISEGEKESARFRGSERDILCAFLSRFDLSFDCMVDAEYMDALSS